MDYCISDWLIPFSKISLESENILYRFHPNLSLYSPPLSLSLSHPIYPFNTLKFPFGPNCPYHLTPLLSLSLDQLGGGSPSTEVVALAACATDEHPTASTLISPLFHGTKYVESSCLSQSTKYI